MVSKPLAPPSPVSIGLADAVLEGDLMVPDRAQALIVFAHGSGSSRFSSRNRFVAQALNETGLGTLLFDLLTAKEHRRDEHTAEFRFNIDLLADRLAQSIGWVREQEVTRDLHVGLFGASTGAAGALMAAADRPDDVGAIVSRGGRPDLAGRALRRVQAPTLLIVGGLDTVVLELNRQAEQAMLCQRQIEIVPGASHLFEEPGKLEEVARLAGAWFHQWLTTER